jgi:hypothetical protein
MAAVRLQACEDGDCSGVRSQTGGEGELSYVYAIGNIEIRFPSLGVEKEFAQVTGRSDTAGLTDQQTLQTVLSEPSNRYLTRLVCWVLTIEGLDTYILTPREASDYDQLIASVRSNPSRQDRDVIIGVRGTLAPPSLCNGLTVPMVGFSQIYSFDQNAFVEAVPVPEGQNETQFRATVNEIFERILKVADNAGATDEHRALNYLATRYPALYRLSSERFLAGYSLTAFETAPSRLSGARNMINVNLIFTNRETQVPERYSVRVDVTEEFPFLASPLTPAPFIER